MNIMGEKITDLKTIGERLEAARILANVRPKDVMEAVDPDAATSGWYHWIKGEREGGCRSIAKAALFLGMTPNTLLLEDTIEDGERIFTDADRIGLDQINEILWRLTKLGGPTMRKRPVALVLENLQAIVSALPNVPNSPPAGEPKSALPDQSGLFPPAIPGGSEEFQSHELPPAEMPGTEEGWPKPKRAKHAGKKTPGSSAPPTS
jgi:hypothetical protein